MRTKTRGGRARLPKFHSPSLTTSSFPLLNRGEADGEHSIGRIAPGTSSKKNDDDGGGVVASAYCDDETDIRVENHSGLGLSEDCMDIDQLEAATCLKCDRADGNLLPCCQFGCPIALHENCMNGGPKFDDDGNFYCPYCWYKRKVVKTQELRKKAVEAKKALARFIDFKRDGGDKEKENDRTDGGKELNDRMDDGQVENQLMEVKEEQTDDRDQAKLADSSDHLKMIPESHGQNRSDSHEKTLGVQSFANSTSKEIPSEEKISKTYELEILEDGETIGQVDDIEHEKIVEDDIGHERIVEDNSGYEKIVEDQLQEEPCNASCREQGNAVDGSPNISKENISGQQRREEEENLDIRHDKIVEDDIGHEMIVEDNSGYEKIVDDQLQEEPCNASFRERGNAVYGSLNISKENISDQRRREEEQNLDIRHEKIVEDDRGYEKIVEDQLQEEPCNASCGEKENTVDGSLNISKENPDPKMLGTAMSDSDMETILMHQRRLRQSRKTAQSQNVDLPKKLSSPRGATPVKIARPRKEKATASRKSTQQVSAGKFTGFSFANQKRKRLLWTAEEESMLKEGVHKFSSRANKNLPWRKVLEFGCRVFDPTRTPADLKDKWRNIMAKESSAANRK